MGTHSLQTPSQSSLIIAVIIDHLPSQSSLIIAQLVRVRTSVLTLEPPCLSLSLCNQARTSVFVFGPSYSSFDRQYFMHCDTKHNDEGIVALHINIPHMVTKKHWLMSSVVLLASQTSPTEIQVKRACESVLLSVQIIGKLHMFRSAYVDKARNSRSYSIVWWQMLWSSEPDT